MDPFTAPTPRRLREHVVRWRLDDLQLPLADAAAELGTSASSLSRWMTGNAQPTPMQITQLAARLRMPVEWLSYPVPAEQTPAA